MNISNKKIELFLKAFGSKFTSKNIQKSPKVLSLNGLNHPLKLLIVDYVKSLGCKILFLVQNEQTALNFQADLKNLTKSGSKILPCAQTQFYEDVPNNLYIYQEQLEALLGNDFNGDKQENIIIAPVKTVFEKFPEKNFYMLNSFELKKGKEYDYSGLKQKLTDFGYKNVTQVNDIGEFSLRGDILDLYTYEKLPVRVEFFGDTVEDIRYFNPNTQKSVTDVWGTQPASIRPKTEIAQSGKQQNTEPEHLQKRKSIDSVKILPLYKFLPDEKNIEEFEKYCSAQKNKELCAEICEKLNNSKYFEGIEYYGQFFNKNLVSIFEYFQDYVIIFEERAQILGKIENLDEEYKKEFEISNNSEIKLPLKTFSHNTYKEIENLILTRPQLGFDAPIAFMNESETIDFNSNLAPNFSANISQIVSYIKQNLQENAKIYICTNFKKRFEEILNEHEIFSPQIIIVPQIQSGGEFYNEDDTGRRAQKLIFLTDKELFNQRQKPVVSSKYIQNKLGVDYIESINDIKESEYIVHNIHGIGLYRGLSKQEIDGHFKDYLLIEFAGSDKLYMPAEQVNLLVRYRGEGASHPKLSKMGGNAWENTKNKVKKEVEEIAYELLNLYARREMSTGIAFDPDTTWQVEMEEAFEFIETPDQMKAIIETKADMETPRPMDRLICADVGFGKTEVAIRAIFKCIMSGRQALMIAPTTILSLQHFQTIQERFKPFSIEVELLSRFVSKKEQKLTLEKLKEGKVDVVIGTHRLLQDDISPKNLGLLVVDEEHRFGVKHKEKLKKIRENIDILSLSATPIPRTLNMALSGLKDMSVINTPPKNRLPVRTFVGESAFGAKGGGHSNSKTVKEHSDFNNLEQNNDKECKTTPENGILKQCKQTVGEKIIKNAIEFELGRDGQVFYLHNRVNTIYNMQKYLQSIVPSAKIAVAHGQMKENELEKIMLEFSLRNYDILLCTTIIESGLDIPNANTIIIDDCDKFGLAQLYQLRGRVGRSDRQAFCYCLYKSGKELNEEAVKRLNAIKEFTSLGSGYHIALRDIEIRGVGNILGAKQHGHMANVGFDTYCNLLEEAVNELKTIQKGEKPAEKSVSAIIDINTTAFIPDIWVGSVEQKMIEYKRLSDVKTLSELEEATISLKDRFSKLPESVENLIKLIKLRLLASSNRITRIQETPNNIRIYTPFTVGEWKLIRSKLSKNISKYFTFQNAPKTSVDGGGIILMDKNYFDFNKIFNILTDLLYDISSIVVELLEN